MKTARIVPGLLLLAAAAATAFHPNASAQAVRDGAVVSSDGALPSDVFPESRSRLPLIKREDLDEPRKKAYDDASSSGSGVPQGLAAIRLHGSGVDVRWESSVGRRLAELVILTTARESDQPYEWSLHEMEALAVGLEPAIIDVVRYRKPVEGIGDREAGIIQLDREVVSRHKLSSAAYANALQLFGETNLVDMVILMSQYAGTAARLTAFNQQLPPQMKQFLPLPFALPSDIHEDSRSRLPLIKTQSQAPTTLYSRELGPAGTGPQQLALHRAGRKSLESHVGQRLMELAILVTAREHDQQYDWTMNEPAARNNGLEPMIIDVVRDRRPTTGLGEKEAAIIEFGRELFAEHLVKAETYARTVKLLGETDLVDLVDLMAQHASEATLLTAFDQHLPARPKS